MMIQIISVLLVLSIVLPIGAYMIMRNRNSNKITGKRVLKTNVVAFFGLMITATVMMFSGNINAAAAGAASSATLATGLGYLAAALVTGLSTVGAGIAVASAASAALGALSEDPKIMGKALIFVALAEGIALYGLLVSFMILGKLG
jgi:ATP synthase subunit C.